MKTTILDKWNLSEITKNDLDEIRLYISECDKNTNQDCKKLIERYNRLFDILQRHIDGVEYNPNIQNN